MLNKKNINDERVTQLKHKITNEAFGIMFLSLVAIVFIKSVVLHIPTKEFITEFILFIGISFYLFIRMIVTGIYAQNIRNSTPKNRLFTAALSDIIFVLSMGALQYSQGTFNILFLICMAVIFFITFNFILIISDIITENRIKKLTEDDEDK